MFAKNRSLYRRLKILGIGLSLTWLAALLAACQSYNGFPTAVPEPTVAATPTVRSAPPARPTLPPPPTPTPRPTLPAAPTSVPQDRADLLKDGFEKILGNYYHKIDSADLYEVSLRSIGTTLEQGGVANPEIPLPDFSDDDNSNWQTFLNAYSIVVDKYKTQVDEKILSQIALNSAAGSLQDCETGFFSATRSEDYLVRRSGQGTLFGIGVEIRSYQTSNGRWQHLISRTIAGAPAEKAGLKTGDQLLSVDNTDATAKSGQDIVPILQGRTTNGGQPLPKATLKVRRVGGKEETIEITRAAVPLPVIEKSILPDKIGYLKISRFPVSDQKGLDANIKLFAAALDEFDKSGVTSLIVDLRGNAYGSVRLLQSYLSYFISSSELVYFSGQDSSSGTRQYATLAMPSVKDVKATDKPLAVLVDGGTTGEAEIFAHAIQKAKRGTVVGETSAGCLNASVPLVLNDDSVLNVTTYRTISDLTKPESVVANLQPDQKVELDPQLLAQGKDSQLEAAIKAVKKN